MFLTEERNILQSSLMYLKALGISQTFWFDLIKNGNAFYTLTNAHKNFINSATDIKELDESVAKIHNLYEAIEAAYDQGEKTNPESKDKISELRKKFADFKSNLNKIIADKRKELSSLKENTEIDFDDIEDELFWSL